MTGVDAWSGVSSSGAYTVLTAPAASQNGATSYLRFASLAPGVFSLLCRMNPEKMSNRKFSPPPPHYGRCFFHGRGCVQQGTVPGAICQRSNQPLCPRQTTPGLAGDPRVQGPSPPEAVPPHEAQLFPVPGRPRHQRSSIHFSDYLCRAIISNAFLLLDHLRISVYAWAVVVKW